MPILKIAQNTEGGTRAWDVELGDRVLTLGRDKGCAIPIDDKAVSRNHARIEPSPEGYRLRDLGSSNGTWVNGRRITEAILQDGDEVRLGGCVLKFVLPPDQAKTVMLGAEALKSYLPPGVPAVPPPVAPPAPAPAAPPVPAPIAPPPPPAYAPPPPPPAQMAPPAYTPPPPPPSAPPPAYAPPPLPAQGPYPPPRPPRPAAVAAPRGYAGFWIRLVAYILDGLIFGIPGMIIQFLAVLAFGAILKLQPGTLPIAILLSWPVVAALYIAYYVFFTGRKGGTPGKLILGLRVVRDDGVEPVGYGKAFIRFLGTIVSSIPFYIGFIMIAFTDRKRGLHDMIAGTTVVKAR